MTLIRFALAAIAFSATAAQAQDLCADRPGKGTPACVVDAGTVQIETSLADWSRTDQAASREDDLLLGDTLVKYGLGDAVELHAAFTAYQRDRVRDGAGADIAMGFGDISLGARWRAVDGGDSHVSVALQPMVTLPVGGKAVSQGTWSLDVTAPVDVPLSDRWSLNLSPTIAAAADQDGDGRHLAWGGEAGVSDRLDDQLTLGGELWMQRDDDPAGHATQASADLTLAWQPGKDWQLDLSGYAGLTAATPDVEIVAGVVRRF
jgi:hypothetical protein